VLSWARVKLLYRKFLFLTFDDLTNMMFNIRKENIMNNELGKMIKKIRVTKGMTLKELSKETDLSISFLSMVERGLTSVAIISLKKIADALDQNVSSFFVDNLGDCESEAYTINRSYAPNLRNIAGHYIYYSLTGKNKDFLLDPMLINLLPGQTKKDVIMFKHEGEEFTYVLEGVLTFFIEDKEYIMYPGDSYHGFCYFSHNFVNLSNNIVKVLYILTPPLFQHKTSPHNIDLKNSFNG